MLLRCFAICRIFTSVEKYVEVLIKHHIVVTSIANLVQLFPCYLIAFSSIGGCDETIIANFHLVTVSDDSIHKNENDTKNSLVSIDENHPPTRDDIVVNPTITTNTSAMSTSSFLSLHGYGFSAGSDFNNAVNDLRKKSTDKPTTKWTAEEVIMYPYSYPA